MEDKVLFYILLMPKRANIFIIKAANIDDLIKKIDNPTYFDKFGEFYEPDIESLFVTSYKKITKEVRNKLQKRTKKL